ncbi:LADA_0G00496g1_1 [Lachancea dasiensis]|uniref:LADA_0G00496g1_1 n=1 Tax=Lachancea dasiensis TaxID=1072105 RepID=A0A1G4JQ79_9SACH|nr:LADA_0G00496g1_1 [Lachancea dasiensis]
MLTDSAVFAKSRERTLTNEMHKLQPLYGGAIVCPIPEGFLDASILREVPDTQEVFVNSRDVSEQGKFEDGLGLDESIIVDLLERVEASNDRAALEMHLEEITGLNGSNDWTVARLAIGDGVVAHQTCIAVETAYKWGKEDHSETLVLCVALLRLEDVQTDVVLSVNLPINKTDSLKDLHDWIKDPTTDAPRQVESAYNVLTTMASNFKVLDSSLFV